MENPTLIPRVETRVRQETLANGRLNIYETVVNGEVTMALFSLESLAACLDMPMSTADGRYARSNLRQWMIPIMNRNGRPSRGFAYHQLQDVISLLTTKGATIIRQGDVSGPAVRPARQQQDLVPEYFNGKRYYTVPALAAAFGFSETTIRKKLVAAGLSRKFIDLAVPMYGGRPKRGIEEKYLGDVKLAVVDQLRYAETASQIMGTSAQYATHRAAQQEMTARVVNHEIPVPNSMRAYDNRALAPVVPLNPVNRRASTFDTDKEVEELVAEITAMMEDTHLPGASLAPAQVVSAVVDGDEEDEAANRQRAYAWQVEMLTAQPDEPTDEEYRETAYMLALDKAGTERFIEEVKATRAQRGGL